MTPNPSPLSGMLPDTANADIAAAAARVAEGRQRILAEIRKAVVEDESLSTNAHNVKIITVDGKVTLRGPVDSEDERKKVVEAAKKVVGPERVQDQLELAGR